jgi:hypothetical protein
VPVVEKAIDVAANDGKLRARVGLGSIKEMNLMTRFCGHLGNLFTDESSSADD